MTPLLRRCASEAVECHSLKNVPAPITCAAVEVTLLVLKASVPDEVTIGELFSPGAAFCGMCREFIRPETGRLADPRTGMWLHVACEARADAAAAGGR